MAFKKKPISAVSKILKIPTYVLFDSSGWIPWLGFLKPSLTETNGEKACIYDIDKDDKDDYQDHNYAATFMHV